MVFESFVDDFIKKYLGDYVEKCDPEISIPTGCVVLKNLVLKENALDDFDLPVKIKTGHIQKITLLIQWTNLYTKPLVVKIDGVYVLAVPNVAQKKNEEKEEEAKQKSKKKKIQRIEDALQLDAERDQSTTEDKKKKPKKDSFFEKMTAHIIKNLEVKVINVHVRYEDNYTSPEHPFSIGVSLKKLHLKTTDEKWKECSVKESVNQIFKLIKLDSLAVYWNVDSDLFDSRNKTNTLFELSNGIADSEKDPGFQYLIKPISPEAKLSLNTKPELNTFSIPKASLTISLDDISVEISKLQFNSALEMIESFKGVKLLRKNKEQRPDRPVKRHAKQWWHYAGNSIFHDIHRRKTMWSWTYIERHRTTMKQYKNAYIKKLNEKKINKDLQQQLDNFERDLNVLSIISMRQLAELEASKHRITQEKRNKEGDREKKPNEMIEKIEKVFPNQFTAEEKDKLYNAIGYEENNGDITLPENFIAERLEMSSMKMTLSLKDTESNDPYIINFQLQDVSSIFGHRPAANAVKIEAKVKKYTVKGTPQNRKIPIMALSQTVGLDDKNALLDVWFETNPHERDCDTRITLNTRHIEFIYDAVTVNNLVKFAKPPHNVDVQQLSKTALGTFEAIKEYSATGLRHAINQTKFTKISVDIQPSYVIIPNNGYYKKGCRALIIDLGNLKVCTEKRKSNETEKQKMTKEELMEYTYDRFDITLDRLQILFSTLGEEWRVCRKQSQSDMHMLEPIKLNVVLHKYMLDKDLKLAKMIMSGELPLLSLNVSDQRLHDLIKLANSIPLPESALIPKREILLAMSLKNIKMKDAAIVATAKCIKSKSTKSKPTHFPNYIKMEISFVIKQVDINISQKDKEGKTVQEVRLVVDSVGTKAAVHTYDIDVNAYIGGIKVQHTQIKGVDCHVVVNLVNTPSEDGSKKLLQLHYIKTKTNGPHFATAYSGTEQNIDVSFTSMQLLLHQEAMLHVLELVEKLKLASKKENKAESGTSTTQTGKWRQKKDTQDIEKKKKKKRKTRKLSAKLTCKLKIKFEIECLSATLYVDQNDLMAQGADTAAISEINLQDITVYGEQMSDKSMEVNIKLKDIVIDDCRQHKIEGITKMIQRRQSPMFSEGASSMIDVTYKLDCSENSTVIVRIKGVYICVCLDYLTSIRHFATKCMPKTERMESAKQKTKESKTQKKEKSYNIDFDVKIEKPEIILIEDQLNLDCNCLVLNAEVNFEMKDNSISQDMSAKVKDLQIFSCGFNKRGSVAAQILNNCTVEFKSKKSADKGDEMRLDTSDLMFHISPATIKTISRICASLSSKSNKELMIEKCIHKIPADLWETKNLSDSDFWFLKLSENPDNKQEDIVDELTEEEVKLEQLIATVPLMVILIEGGVGERTVPLIKVESSVSADVNKLSSQLSIEGTFELEAKYYNEKLSVWEHLLEPVLEDGEKKRWGVGLEIKMNEEMLASSNQERDRLDKPAIPPKITVNALSNVVMQLTLSKTSLEVLHNLYKAFGDAYMMVEPSNNAGEILAPLCIHNKTGMEVVIILDDSFEIPKDSHDFEVKMQPRGQLKLWNKEKREQASLKKGTQEGDVKKIICHFAKFDTTREVTVKRAEKRLYQISPKKQAKEVLSFIVKTETSLGQKIVSIQSIIQIKNNFLVPIELYYQALVPIFLGVVAPDSIFNLPLTVDYTEGYAFQFKPEGRNYNTSSSLEWKDVKKLRTVQVLKCEQSNGSSPFYISIRVEVEEVYFEVGDSLLAKTYIFHLSPAVTLHNLLPYPITVKLEGIAEQTSIKKGENTALMNTCVNNSWVNIIIPRYKGKTWIGKTMLRSNLPAMSTVTFEASQCTPECTMNLGLHCQKNDEECIDISVFSPYWMVNKTGKNLFYKASDGDTCITHEHAILDIVLFSFKEKTLFSSTKEASLKMTDSDWSNKFSLDTVGKARAVECRNNKEQTFAVGVQITKSSCGFTKICTFTPFYTLMNTSKYSVLCQEKIQNGINWIEVPSKECIPFWPVQSGKDLAMKAKFSRSDVETSQFLLSEAHTTLLKLSTQHGGLKVNCKVTKSGIAVTFSEYRDGMATVLLVNHTEKAMVRFHQSGIEKQHVLNANQYMLYTWECSTNKQEIIWTCGETTNQANLLQQDENGEFCVYDERKVYWVSFLNGLQRTLLFTEDRDLTTFIQETGGSERIEKEINIGIQGLGVSLVNDYKQKEVAYLGVTSRGVLWDKKENNCVTTLNADTAGILEKGYQQYITELRIGHIPPTRVHLEKTIEVDWNEMMLYDQNKIPIRRRFKEGIILQIKTSPHQIQLHAEIQRLQFDNQMSDGIFQTVLAPTPLARSMVPLSEPFTELTLKTRKSNHSNIIQLQCLEIMTKEMTLNVDLHFIKELIELLPTSDGFSRHQQTILLEKDYKKAMTALAITNMPSDAQKNFYDYLHISSIKLNFSFSSQGCSDLLFVQTFGVLLSDVKDVVLIFNAFKKKHKFYHLSEIQEKIKKHYMVQAGFQLPKIVLGIDALGNPAKIFDGLAEDIFGDPEQGRVGSFVGHAAGAASRITGALGKGIAALTMDDDYQKKRRQFLNNKRQADITERIARDGKGVLKGFYHGVTGIVKKPLQGAQTDGVGGFFKGIGKGIVGVVTRPASGLIDFASGRLEGIERLIETPLEINRQRIPRMFSVDKIIRPYNIQKADGYMLLQETDKGKFAITDHYVGHAVISKDGRHVLIITDKRLIYANRGDILGYWNAEWSYTWGEMQEAPKRTEKGIGIVLKEKETLFSFRKGPTTKDVNIFDPATADGIHRKMKKVHEKARVI